MSTEKEFIEELKKYIKLEQVEEAVKHEHKFSFENENFEVKADDENHILVTPCGLGKFQFLDDMTIAFERLNKQEQYKSKPNWTFNSNPIFSRNDYENRSCFDLNDENSEILKKSLLKISENADKPHGGAYLKN